MWCFGLQPKKPNESLLKPVGIFPWNAQGFALDFICFLQIWPKASGMTLFWDTHTVPLRSALEVRKSSPPEGKQGPTRSTWGPMDLITPEALMKCLYGARALSATVRCLCRNHLLPARQLCVLGGRLWCALLTQFCNGPSTSVSRKPLTSLGQAGSGCPPESVTRSLTQVGGKKAYDRKMSGCFICSQERELSFLRLA